MTARLGVAVALACAGFCVAAAETPTWPPPPEVLGRMRDLQATIASPAASKEERAAARRELERLMKSPAAPAATPGEAKKPARAAIDPYPSVVKPADEKLRVPPPETARLEVIPDPPVRRPLVNPSTGSVIQPASPGFAVDSKTGALLHETPTGYVDPRSGRFVPK